jgi:hypothetical protein
MIKQVLSLVIHASKNVSGLQHLQVLLKNMRDETGRNAAALAVAAGLKAARMETQEDEKVQPASVWWAANNIGYTKLATHNIPRTQRNKALAPHQPHLLTNFVVKISNPFAGSGLYSGKPIEVEYKTAKPKLKRKVNIPGQESCSSPIISQGFFFSYPLMPWFLRRW